MAYMSNYLSITNGPILYQFEVDNYILSLLLFLLQILL